MGPDQNMYDTFLGRRDYNPNSVPDLDTSVSEGDGTIFANQTDQNIDETSTSEGDHEPPAHRTRSRLTTHPPKNVLTAATLSSIPEFKDCTNYTQTQQWEHAAGGNLNSKVSNRDIYMHHIQSLDWEPSKLLNGSVSHTRAILSRLLMAHTYGGEWDPLALAAKSNNEDDFTWEQAMNSPHEKGFWKAAKLEFEMLQKMRIWEIVDRQPWMNVLPMTWSFRVKRTIEGLIRKFKGRICARGDLQKPGVHFDPFNIWIPVVSWITVCLLLILSTQLSLQSKKVDYISTFVHAPIPNPSNWDELTPQQKEHSGVFIQMPRGFARPGKVLKLRKALYGLKDSPKIWSTFLKEKLEKVGFKQAVDVNACLFISPKVICITYVDDTLFFARDMKDIDLVIMKL